LTETDNFVGQFNVDPRQEGAFVIGITFINFVTAQLAVVDDDVNDVTVIDQNVVPGE
jgi:hypothetical protein